MVTPLIPQRLLICASPPRSCRGFSRPARQHHGRRRYGHRPGSGLYGCLAGITAAIDHIRCFKDSLITSRTPAGIKTLVRTHSQYTLLRAALWNASLARWLLAADDRAERITCRLRVEAASIEAMARLHNVTGFILDPAKADRIARLPALAAKAGLTTEQVAESAKPAGSGEAIRGAAIARGSDPVVAQLIWSMGSGVPTSCRRLRFWTKMSWDKSPRE
jgi:hypothetical protein